MSCEYYSSNKIPIGVGYDANGNAKSFVELSAITVGNVSATEYQNLPIQGITSIVAGANVTVTNATGPQVTIAAAGGGGASFPHGSTGDILYYYGEGTATVTSIVPTASPLNLATTGYVAGQLADYLPVNATADVTGPVTFVVNQPQFPVGFDATGPATHTGDLTFDTKPNVGGTNVTIATDLDAYVTEDEYNTSADLFTTTGTFYTTTATLVTKDGFDGSAADFVTNVEYDTSADLFVATSITTTQSRTFLGTTTDLDTLNNVITLDDGLADGDVLTYSTGAGATWYNAPVAAKTLTFGNKSVTPGASGAYTVSNAVTVPPGNSGKGDSTANSFIFFSGTNASSTEFVGTRWGANWVEGPQNIETTDGNYFAYVSATTTGDSPGASGVAAVALNANALEFIENGSATTATFAALTVNGTAPSSTIAPTLAGHLTTKTYVDTVDAAIIAGSVLKAIPGTISAKHTATGGISFTTVAPSSTVTPATDNDLTNKTYVDTRTGAPMTVLAIGSGTADVDGVEHDMHWKVPAISDANITFAATEGSSITFATAGTYQLDVAARLNGGNSGYNRLQGTIMTYKYDADSGVWVKLTDHTSDCYVTRDATTGPFGSFNLNTMLALTAGDQIKFSVSANSLGSQCDMTEEGTILRIVGWS